MSEWESKDELRDLLRSKRARISRSDFVDLSKRIIVRLQRQREYDSAGIIHCYVSMNDRREVDTHPLIKTMTATGKRVVVPVTHFEDRRLSHFELTSFDDLISNKWGVLEPKPKDSVRRVPSELELVIVPMVGGDEQRHRIGYGGGFYDRFLKKVSCSKIGLCFEQNIVSEFPAKHYDVPLDKIITEERIIM